MILDFWYLYCKQSRPIPCSNGAYILEEETLNTKKNNCVILCQEQYVLYKVRQDKGLEKKGRCALFHIVDYRGGFKQGDESGEVRAMEALVGSALLAAGAESPTWSVLAVTISSKETSKWGQIAGDSSRSHIMLSALGEHSGSNHDQKTLVY